MLKLLDLFSGIGGFSLGMETTKQIRTIGFVEKDKFCQKVLRKNFKNVPMEEDIRNVKGSNYTADIISGGVPCQPFSVAGKRKGTEDNRYLWPQMFRVITEVKPKFVVVENVQGLININNGLVLRQVQTDMEAQGFQVQCFLIPASGIGAWHKRNRIWIIAANPSSQRSSTQSIGVNRKLEEKSKGKKEERYQSTLCTSSLCSKEQQTWWQTQSKLCGVPNGISYELDKDRTNRIKTLGNAIVPQIAYEIGQAILKAEYE